MASGLLDLIARPQIVDFGERFRAGQQQARLGPLQERLLQAQVAEAEQAPSLAQGRLGIQQGQLDIAQQQQAAQDREDRLKGAMRGIALMDGMNEMQQNEALVPIIQSLDGLPEQARAEQLLQTPFESRGQIIQNIKRVGQQFGIVEKPTTTTKQKTGAYLVRDKETGETKVAVGVFDPTTGALETETASIPGSELVSKLGETGEETTQRKIKQKQVETRVKEQETRAGDLIERGIAAAESTASIRRAISLLDDVKTGGLRAASLRAKQLFGVEGADEGELSNSLGKAVLSQLRETFGAAFTVEEGKRLERIEANFTKSSETNRRLLNQALRIAERTAQRAVKSAEKRGDQETVQDITDLLEFSLDLPATEQPAQESVTGQPTQVLNFDAQGRLIQ